MLKKKLKMRNKLNRDTKRRICDNIIGTLEKINSENLITKISVQFAVDVSDENNCKCKQNNCNVDIKLDIKGV